MFPRALQQAYRGMLFGCISLLLMSCEKRGVYSDYDEAVVKKLVVPGTTRSEIYSYFGKPMHENKTSNGETVLIYRRPTQSFRTEDLMADKGGFSGFEVYFLDDKVLGWEPITSGPVHH